MCYIKHTKYPKPEFLPGGEQGEFLPSGEHTRIGLGLSVACHHDLTPSGRALQTIFCARGIHAGWWGRDGRGRRSVDQHAMSPSRAASWLAAWRVASTVCTGVILPAVNAAPGATNMVTARGRGGERRLVRIRESAHLAGGGGYGCAAGEV